MSTTDQPQAGPTSDVVAPQPADPEPLTQADVLRAQGVVRNIKDGQVLAETLRGLLANNPTVMATIGLRGKTRSYIGSLATSAWHAATDLTGAEHAPFLRALAVQAPPPLPQGPLGKADRVLMSMMGEAPAEHLEWIRRLFVRVLQQLGAPPAAGAVDPELDDVLRHPVQSQDTPPDLDEHTDGFLNLPRPPVPQRQLPPPIPLADVRTYLVPMAELCARLTDQRLRQDIWADWCHDMERTAPSLATKTYGQLHPTWQDRLPVPHATSMADQPQTTEPWQPVERAAHLVGYSTGALRNIIPQLKELDPTCVRKTDDGLECHVPTLRTLKESKRIISPATWRRMHPPPSTPTS